MKALAEQTAKATGEIGQQITGIQSATQDSVGAIQEISGTIERLSEISSAIAAAVEEQGAATQEISRNVQQAAQGTQQVSANITDVQRGATETGYGLVAGSLGGAVAVRRQQPAQARGRPNSSNRCAPPDVNPAAGAGARLRACLRNRMRWYSQPIATSTRPRHMNDSAR